jgi:hypothetical protein
MRRRILRLALPLAVLMLSGTVPSAFAATVDDKKGVPGDLVIDPAGAGALRVLA